MTISEILELHPDGDTFLILRHSGGTSAAEGFEINWPNTIPTYQTEAPGSYGPDATSIASQDDESEIGGDHLLLTQVEQEPEILRFKLSSAVLVDTSTYFKKALSKNWNKTEPEPGYKWTLEETCWDGEAFLLLMRILHHKTRSVPRQINLNMLAKVAVLVDYYGIHEGVEPWPETWMSNSSLRITESHYSTALLHKIMVSWVFRSRETFRETTAVAIRTSQGPIDTLGLPLPESVVGELSKIY